MRGLKRRLQKIIPLVFVLALLTPVAHWLSKEPDEEYLPRKDKDYHRKLIDTLRHKSSDEEFVGDNFDQFEFESQRQESLRNPVKAIEDPAQPKVIEVRNSMNVQLGDFPLKDSMVEVVGGQKTTPTYLTIGIPTIYRKLSGVQYLTTTVKSLLDNLDTDDLPQVQILIFAADRDPELRSHVVLQMKSSFPMQLQSGNIQIMSVNSTAYPPLSNLKRNYNDPDDRVTWRAKQVVDFAFMFYHSRNNSQYYLQLEDDVMSSPHFFSYIQAFVSSQNRHWVTLDFSTLGFIGKLIRTSDLEEFARFLIMFYDEQPVDYLYMLFNKILVQDYPILHRPTLFQHFGWHSSLQGKDSMRIYKDKFFALGRDAKLPVFSIVVNTTKNPAAQIFTSLEAYMSYAPSAPYGEKDGYFWGKTPRAGDVYLIVLHEKQRLESVFIETGRDSQQNDYLRHGVLEISPPNTKPVKTIDAPKDMEEAMERHCGEFNQVAAFEKGIVSLKEMKSDVWTQCVRLTVTDTQEEWIILNNIILKTYNHRNPS